jgi:hypothetical protein
MSQDLRSFKLTQDSVLFLKKLACDDTIIGELLRGQISERMTRVELSLENVERLREQLTLLLAETGFDDVYSLTEQGRMLETLIDLFYVKR